MNGKSLGYCLLCVSLLCGCFYSCLQDDGFSVNREEERFFKADGADEWLRSIVWQLKQKNDSTEFVTDFVEQYGYPLWRDAYEFPENGNVVFAVPVKSTVTDAAIEAIWFFSVTPDGTLYRIYTRAMVEKLSEEIEMDGIEETWMFDYFTRTVLHREPESGLFFKEDSVAAATRGYIYVEETHCVEAYAGYDGAEEYQGRHCWTTTTAHYISEISDDERGGGGGMGNGYIDGGFIGGWRR